MVEDTEKNIYPFKRGQFLCKECEALFYAEREKIQLEDDAWWATCPKCGGDGLETHSMQNLHKTIGTAKGANMSEEGRAKTRLNGFTTGSTSLSIYHKGKIAMPPAKPGKYPECDGCMDIEACKAAVMEKQGTCIPVYCHRKFDVMQKYVAGYMSGDPEMMRLLAADNAAQMQMVLNASFKKVFERGVEVVEKIVDMDKEGNIVNTTERIYAHPLIKQCLAIMQGMGFSLTDWTMTPKSKEAKEQVAGFLAGMSVGSGKTVDAVTDEMKGHISKFMDKLDQARELREKDETLKAFEAESGKRDKE